MASINVLILTSDREYNEKLGQYMSRHHADIRLSIVDSIDNLKQVMAINFFSVILVDTEFAELNLSLPNKVAFAYLSASDADDMLNERKVFCKYKSGETLYKIILDMYSEVSSKSAVNDTDGSVFAFVGAGGGVGTTSVAVAFAKRIAASGKRTLYINPDKFFESTDFLTGETIGNMSDLLFAIISAERSRGSVNVSAKARALMCKDISGVNFIKSCKNPFEFNDINEDRLNTLYSAMLGESLYDVIVLDIQAQDNTAWKLAVQKANKIFVVAENSPCLATKLSRFVSMLQAYESHEPGIIAKTAIIMNKNVDRNTNWESEVCGGVPFLGSIPRYADNNVQSIMNAMMLLEMWNRLNEV